MRYLLLLLALAVPALAQPLGYLPYPTYNYQGVVQQITPQGVVISANGVNMMLPGGLNFNVGGVQVGLNSLAVGQPVMAYVPAGSGQIMGYANNLYYVQTPQGILPVPINQISPQISQKTKVNVLKPNGKVVNVPLNAALNMQQSQGATILGANTTPWQIPVYNVNVNPIPVNYQGGNPGKGKGNNGNGNGNPGKGKGKKH